MAGDGRISWRCTLQTTVRGEIADAGEPSTVSERSNVLPARLATTCERASQRASDRQLLDGQNSRLVLFVSNLPSVRSKVSTTACLPELGAMGLLCRHSRLSGLLPSLSKPVTKGRKMKDTWKLRACDGTIFSQTTLTPGDEGVVLARTTVVPPQNDGSMISSSTGNLPRNLYRDFLFLFSR